LEAIRDRLDVGGIQTLALEHLGAQAFELRPDTLGARLVCDSDFVPGDTRRLGAAVSAIRVDGEVVALDDAAPGHGWHAAEASWRWTNGAASFWLPPGARRLDVEISSIFGVMAEGEERRRAVG